jgi:hypothetical protein
LRQKSGNPGCSVVADVLKHLDAESQVAANLGSVNQFLMDVLPVDEMLSGFRKKTVQYDRGKFLGANCLQLIDRLPSNNEGN